MTCATNDEIILDASIRGRIEASLARNTAILPSGCIVWTRRLKRGGYGAMCLWYRGKRTAFLVHRAAWVLKHGTVAPLGNPLDHLCRNTACCNPDHLEPVSQRENVLRGIGRTAVNSKKTHCPQGHEYTPENTYTCKNNSRYCKECQRVRDRLRWRRRAMLRQYDAAREGKGEQK